MSTSPPGSGQGPEPYRPPPIDPATGQPYGQPLPPAVGYGAEPPKGKSMTWYWVGTVVAVLAVGVGAYLFGHSQGEKQYDPGTAKYNEIYNAGVASGKKGGLAVGQATGTKQGEAAGHAAGLQQGTEQGVAQGTADGANTALGGFGTWNTSATFYVITMKPGPQTEVPFEVSSRLQMDPTVYYSPCQSNPATLCTFPRPPAGAQAGTDTTTTGG